MSKANKKGVSISKEKIAEIKEELKDKRASRELVLKENLNFKYEIKS